jgi:hypothetical protein
MERIAYIRFESAPGEQLQTGWGHFGTLAYDGSLSKLYALAVTEGAGRLIRFSDRLLEFLTRLGIFPKACNPGPPMKKARLNGRSAICKRTSGLCGALPISPM